MNDWGTHSELKKKKRLLMRFVEEDPQEIFYVCVQT